MDKLMIAALAAGVAAVPALAQPQAAPAQMPMQRADAVQSRAQALATARESFARLDSNRDGFVTREEAQAGRAVMRQRIRNGAGLAARAPGAAVPNRASMFDTIDANHDGMISRDEFNRAPTMRQRVAVRGDGARTGTRRANRSAGGAGLGGRMFEMADGNRDNRVSLQEVTEAALRRFDTADVNRDGQLTADERRQARERTRAQRNRG